MAVLGHSLPWPIRTSRLAMVLGIFPVVGMPLPFFSYGAVF
jgi:hypothetical protein